MIYTGDCIEVMKTLPENSVDAMVTDPPYGWRFMGKAWDAFDIRLEFDRRAGEELKRTGKVAKYRPCNSAGIYNESIQGNLAFQIWTTEWAREAYRILKPGAHILVFCGPRTYHRMASGVEDAGFEVRDQLQWLFGSGFPKSLDISKAIDKAAGAEREVIGLKSDTISQYRSPTIGGFRGGNYNNIDDPTYDLRKQDEFNKITAPSTPEAKQWQGFGTALKPANEPILLARKPLSEKTVAANVLRWGCGGINIDSCRITSYSGNDEETQKQYSDRDKGRGDKACDVNEDSGLCSMREEDSSLGFTNQASKTPNDLRESLSSKWNEERGKSAMEGRPMGMQSVRLSASESGLFEREGLEPDSQQKEQAIPGTSSCNGEKIGQAIEADRTSPSHQREQERQSIVKSMPLGMGRAFQGTSKIDERDCGASNGKSKAQKTNQVTGRFPANLVLSHNPDCVEVGVKKVKGSNDPRKKDGVLNSGGMFGVGENKREVANFNNSDGTETVPAWECSEGCAVAELDRQSGVLKTNPGTYRREKRNGAGNTYTLEGSGVTSLGDSGGASRFFYCAKASRRDKNAGCEGLPTVMSKTMMRGASGSGKKNFEGGFQDHPTLNNHPTVKPTRLMSYLIKLITPPNGTVMDPFLGSGTTAVAAIQEGFQFIGIEKEAEYVAIAQARIKSSSQQQFRVKETTRNEGTNS